MTGFSGDLPVTIERDLVTIGDWSFSLHSCEDASVEYAEAAVRAWSQWLRMLRDVEVVPIECGCADG